MSHERTTLEVIAPTIEEAVEKGAAQLNMPKEMLDVEVLDEGNRGFLGIGSRQARIRLSIKVDDRMDEQPSAETTAQTAASAEVVESSVSDEDQVLELSKSVVEELLQKMKVNAEVEARYVEPQDERDQQALLLDIQGNDLSILIGRRSETLNALQYVTNLIVGKQLGRWVPLVIDVQGYRFRRERQLKKLARRMADQAVQSGRRQVLEPMPANERRMVHLALREYSKVTTQSVGEEPYRKVTILPRK